MLPQFNNVPSCSTSGNPGPAYSSKLSLSFRKARRPAASPSIFTSLPQVNDPPIPFPFPLLYQLLCPEEPMSEEDESLLTKKHAEYYKNVNPTPAKSHFPAELMKELDQGKLRCYHYPTRPSYSSPSKPFLTPQHIHESINGTVFPVTPLSLIQGKSSRPKTVNLAAVVADKQSRYPALLHSLYWGAEHALPQSLCVLIWAILHRDHQLARDFTEIVGIFRDKLSRKDCLSLWRVVMYVGDFSLAWMVLFLCLDGRMTPEMAALTVVELRAMCLDISDTNAAAQQIELTTETMSWLLLLRKGVRVFVHTTDYQLQQITSRSLAPEVIVHATHTKKPSSAFVDCPGEGERGDGWTAVAAMLGPAWVCALEEYMSTHDTSAWDHWDMQARALENEIYAGVTAGVTAVGDAMAGEQRRGMSLGAGMNADDRQSGQGQVEVKKSNSSKMDKHPHSTMHSVAATPISTRGPRSLTSPPGNTSSLDTSLSSDFPPPLEMSADMTVTPVKYITTGIALTDARGRRDASVAEDTDVIITYANDRAVRGTGNGKSTGTGMGVDRDMRASGPLGVKIERIDNTDAYATRSTCDIRTPHDTHTSNTRADVNMSGVGRPHDLHNTSTNANSNTHTNAYSGTGPDSGSAADSASSGSGGGSLWGAYADMPRVKTEPNSDRSSFGNGGDGNTRYGDGGGGKTYGHLRHSNAMTAIAAAGVGTSGSESGMGGGSGAYGSASSLQDRLWEVIELDASDEEEGGDGTSNDTDSRYSGNMAINNANRTSISTSASTSAPSSGRVVVRAKHEDTTRDSTTSTCLPRRSARGLADVKGLRVKREDSVWDEDLEIVSVSGVHERDQEEGERVKTQASGWEAGGYSDIGMDVMDTNVSRIAMLTHTHTTPALDPSLAYAHSPLTGSVSVPLLSHTRATAPALSSSTPAPDPLSPAAFSHAPSTATTTTTAPSVSGAVAMGKDVGAGNVDIRGPFLATSSSSTSTSASISACGSASHSMGRDNTGAGLSDTGQGFDGSRLVSLTSAAPMSTAPGVCSASNGAGAVGDSASTASTYITTTHPHTTSSTSSLPSSSASSSSLCAPLISPLTPSQCSSPTHYRLLPRASPEESVLSLVSPKSQAFIRKYIPQDVKLSHLFVYVPPHLCRYLPAGTMLLCGRTINSAPALESLLQYRGGKPLLDALKGGLPYSLPIITAWAIAAAIFGLPHALPPPFGLAAFSLLLNGPYLCLLWHVVQWTAPHQLSSLFAAAAIPISFTPKLIQTSIRIAVKLTRCTQVPTPPDAPSPWSLSETAKLEALMDALETRHITKDFCEAGEAMFLKHALCVRYPQWPSQPLLSHREVDALFKHSPLAAWLLAGDRIALSFLLRAQHFAFTVANLCRAIEKEDMRRLHVIARAGVLAWPESTTDPLICAYKRDLSRGLGFDPFAHYRPAHIDSYTQIPPPSRDGSLLHYLLEARVDPNLVYTRSSCIVEEALRAGDPGCLQLLLDYGLRPDGVRVRYYRTGLTGWKMPHSHEFLAQMPVDASDPTQTSGELLIGRRAGVEARSWPFTLTAANDTADAYIVWACDHALRPQCPSVVLAAGGAFLLECRVAEMEPRLLALELLYQRRGTLSSVLAASLLSFATYYSRADVLALTLAYVRECGVVPTKLLRTAKKLMVEVMNHNNRQGASDTNVTANTSSSSPSSSSPSPPSGSSPSSSASLTPCYTQPPALSITDADILPVLWNWFRKEVTYLCQHGSWHLLRAARHARLDSDALSTELQHAPEEPPMECGKSRESEAVRVVLLLMAAMDAQKSDTFAEALVAFTSGKGWLAAKMRADAVDVVLRRTVTRGGVAWKQAFPSIAIGEERDDVLLAAVHVLVAGRVPRPILVKTGEILSPVFRTVLDIPGQANFLAQFKRMSTESFHVARTKRVGLHEYHKWPAPYACDINGSSYAHDTRKRSREEVEGVGASSGQNHNVDVSGPNGGHSSGTRVAEAVVMPHSDAVGTPRRVIVKKRKLN